MDWEFGEVIRRARVGRRMSQEALGRAVHCSPSSISRAENNLVRPDARILESICDVLDLMPEDVGLEGDDVHRRDVLALGVGLGAAVAVSPAPASATAPDPKDLVERSLFRLPEVPPPSREALTTALGQARTSFHEAHYVELGRTLPRLISGSLAARAHDVAARAYVLLAQLATKNYQQYAWLAADRARTQAELTSSPVLAGEAAQAMAIAMRRAGEYDASVDQLQGAASGLDGRSPDHQAMRGVLLLTASYSAAQAGWQGRAMGFLEEAEATARRMEKEHRKLPAPRDFSVDHTRLFRISVHHALGEPGQALRYARQVEPMRLPDAERRARMMMDVCRVYKDDGEPERAFAALRAMEKYAPEEVRRPKIRGIARELLALNGEICGLRRFSQRIGA